MKKQNSSKILESAPAAAKKPRPPRPLASSPAAAKREAAVLRRGIERLKSAPTPTDMDVRATLI